MEVWWDNDDVLLINLFKTFLYVTIHIDMTSKQHFYDLFNEKSDEFFKDLVSTFPNIEEFRYWRSGLSLMKNMDPKSPQKFFNSNIACKYREYIVNKNEDFFLGDDAIAIESDHKQYWQDFIKYLRQIWKTLDQDNKEVIWKYFHILTVLSDKCISV